MSHQIPSLNQAHYTLVTPISELGLIPSAVSDSATMSGQPHSRLFSELNDYFFVASCEPDPADVGKLKMCIAPTAEGERFFELATPESEFWFHSAEDEALKDLVFAITSRW